MKRTVRAWHACMTWCLPPTKRILGHLAVCGNTVCGYSEDSGFQEGEFGRHIDGILKMDGHKGVTVKIFTSLSKYTERLDQMRELKEEAGTGAVLVTLKSVAL